MTKNISNQNQDRYTCCETVTFGSCVEINETKSLIGLAGKINTFN